jgi:hypothetical protein
MYEIKGGNLDSLSFYDNGPASHLEDCETLADAIRTKREWHEQNYAAWIVVKETQEIIME